MNSFPRIIYLSGPMSGCEDYNYPLFDDVAARLRLLGHSVYSPSERIDPGLFKPREAFAEYSEFICRKADTLVLLPGHEESLGVSAEFALAKNCGLEIFEWSEWE